MNEKDLLLLLSLSTIVSVILTTVLLVSSFTLGEAGQGGRRWAVGDGLLAVSRMVLLAGFLTPALEVWQPWFGPWRHHSLSVSLYLSGLLWHWVALNTFRGKPTPSRLIMWSGALAIGLAWLAIAYHIDNEPQRIRVALMVIAAMTILRLYAGWPLAQSSPGARILIGALCLLVVTDVFSVLSERISTQSSSLYELFVGEMLVGMLSTLGVILLEHDRLRRKLMNISSTDALTGAYNRRGFLPLLERALTNARRAREPVSVVMFDLDRFKRINDHFGHAAGDAVLKGFLQRALEVVRPSDVIARWGGEEFLLLLPAIGLNTATEIADRVREAVSKAPLAHGLPVVTVSAGVACAAPEEMDAECLERLIRLSDQRLYQAKQHRNAVVGSSLTIVALVEPTLKH